MMVKYIDSSEYFWDFTNLMAFSNRFVLMRNADTTGYEWNNLT